MTKVAWSLSQGERRLGRHRPGMTPPACRDSGKWGNGFAGVLLLRGAGCISTVSADRTEEGAPGERLLPLSYHRNKIGGVFLVWE